MVYIFLADGFEDMEAVTPFDLLKRSGIKVRTVGIGTKTVKSAHGLTVTADLTEDEVNFEEMEAAVLPGGMPGAVNLKNSKCVNNALTFAVHNNRIIAAICASPGVVLAGTGILKGKNYTCFPGFEVSEGNYTANQTEKDGLLITANGPASAVKFSAEIIKALGGNIDNIGEFLGK